MSTRISSVTKPTTATNSKRDLMRSFRSFKTKSKIFNYKAKDTSKANTLNESEIIGVERVKSDKETKVNFSNERNFIEIESHTQYTDKEHRHTWYDIDELREISKNITTLVYLVQGGACVSDPVKRGNLIDEVESIKYCELAKQSSNERKNVIEKFLKKQKKINRKFHDKNNKTIDELSQFYSKLVEGHKIRAQKYATKAAIGAKEVYTEAVFCNES